VEGKTTYTTISNARFVSKPRSFEHNYKFPNMLSKASLSSVFGEGALTLLSKNKNRRVHACSKGKEKVG
jgi:hypothetical protein